VRSDLLLSSIARAHLDLCGAPRGAAAVVSPRGEVEAAWGSDAGERTVFRIASMTKSFTSALVLVLRDDGALTLDEPIGRLAPELGGVVGPGHDPAAITLRHLLTMSSGLATDDPWADRHLDATDADLDRWVAAGLRFAHPTGTAFEYSNLGFALIGRVVHRVTGRRVQELVAERLLGPLGMTHTAWTADALPDGGDGGDGGDGADVAHGWHRVDGTLVPELPLGDGVIAPMGGLWSCTADLARWISFLSAAFSDELAPRDDAILRASSRREMQHQHRMAPTRRTAAPDGSMRIAEGGYGMGLSVFVDDRLGKVVTHSGGLPGYGSNMRWMPGGAGVVILANVTYAPMWHAGAALLDALAQHRGVPAAPLGPDAHDAHRAVAARLVAAIAVLLDGGSGDASPPDPSLFADNVAPDQPWAVRSAELRTRLGEPPALIGVEPISGTTFVLVCTARGAVHRLRVQLAPISPPQVQHLAWD
jgi:CubicO group peptidase (beta-lactamase class C family)